MRKNFAVVLVILCCSGFIMNLKAADNAPLSVAVLPFSEKGPGVKSSGSKISELVFAALIADDNLMLVEREKLQSVLDELSLNASGMVDAKSASKIGQLTGAKILVTGTTFKISGKNYIIAKVIGVETGRVVGKKVSGPDNIAQLSEALGPEISKLIAEKKTLLLPKVLTSKDVVSKLKKELAGRKLPKLYIHIPEEHVGMRIVDPAVETEIKLICGKVGFPLTENSDDADIKISGEAFSQFASKHGDFISANARAEIKAADKSGKILAADREMIIKASLSEQIAAKSALQEAGRQLALRLIPKIVE